MSPQPVLTSTRRTTVAGAAAGALAAVLPASAVLSGCDVGDPASPGASPSPQAPADPDTTLVAEVRDTLDALLGFTAGLHRRQPGLRPSVEALLVMHTAHRQALAEPGSPAPRSSAPAGDAAELWALLMSKEKDAQRRLADWSVDARSGSLARLLASMSAGIAAHLAAAPAPQGAT